MNTSNPVMQQAAGATAVIVVITTLVTYFRTMGWWNLDEVQFQATIDLIEKLLPIGAVWVGAVWAARKVTPLDNPQDIDGEELTRPDNSPAIPKAHQEAIAMNKEIDDRRIIR